MAVRFADRTQAHLLRKLWADIFAEDSESFLDYYEKQRMQDNQIIINEVDGNIAAMLHLNPYNLTLLGKVVESRYIVGVATLPEYRHRGLMREMIFASFRYMRNKDIPFTYLIPANPLIYEPFDFTFVYDKPEFNLPAAESSDGMELRRLQAGNYKELADWSNRILETCCDCYVSRSAEYYADMQAMLESDGGFLFDVIKGEERLACGGMWESNEAGGRPEFWEIMAKDEFKNTFMTSNKKPSIMVRIITVEAFLKAFYPILKKDCIYEIQDSFITENNGRFLLAAKSEGQVPEIRRLGIGEAADKLSFQYTIRELADYAFSGIRIFLNELV